MIAIMKPLVMTLRSMVMVVVISLGGSLAAQAAEPDAGLSVNDYGNTALMLFIGLGVCALVIVVARRVKSSR